MLWCLVLICAQFWCIGVSSALECANDPSKDFNLSMLSHRNSSGHWIAQVKLNHKAGSNDTRPWEVDINHATKKCENIDSISILVTLTAPPASETVASIYEKTARIPGEPAGIPSEPARIPADYELIPELGYYKFHTSLKTWHEALKVCEEEGGHLAVLNSEREAKALGIFWDRNPKFGDTEQSKWAHVGFHDSYKEGEYVTIFNKTIVESGYATWYGNDPDGGTNQNCGMASRKENLLADESCTYKTGFFCEIELP